MKRRWVGLLIVAAACSGCTSGSDSHGPAAASPDATVGPTVLSVGHSARSTVPRSRVQIDLHRVVLRTGPTSVVATFTTFNRMHPPWMKAPACGQMGISFENQHLTLFSSSSRVDETYGDTAVDQHEVEVRFLDSRTVRLKVPMEALGTDFSAAEPWIGFANGYVCPPGGQEEDDTGVVTPRL